MLKCATLHEVWKTPPATCGCDDRNLGEPLIPAILGQPSSRHRANKDLLHKLSCTYGSAEVKDAVASPLTRTRGHIPRGRPASRYAPKPQPPRFSERKRLGDVQPDTPGDRRVGKPSATTVPPHFGLISHKHHNLNAFL